MTDLEKKKANNNYIQKASRRRAEIRPLET